MGRLVFSQVVFVGIFCIDLLAPIAPARANTKIRVGLPDFTSSSVPFEIARQMGYFSLEGSRCGSHPHVVRGLRSRTGG